MSNKNLGKVVGFKADVGRWILAIVEVAKDGVNRRKATYSDLEAFMTGAIHLLGLDAIVTVFICILFGLALDRAFDY